MIERDIFTYTWSMSALTYQSCNTRVLRLRNVIKALLMCKSLFSDLEPALKLTEHRCPLQD